MPKMTHKKSNIINTLSKASTKSRNKELIGVISILINSLSSIVDGKDLSDHANEFISKVLIDFHETYESRSDVVKAWKKQFCIQFLELAYGEHDPAERRKGVDRTIHLIDAWKLNAGPLSARHRKNLHAPKPRSGPGKASTLQLVLSRIDDMFEYSISEYHRDKKRWPGLGKKVSAHYVNDLDVMGVFFYTMGLVFGVKAETIRKMSNILQEDQFHLSQRPLNNGFAAHRFFKTMNVKMDLTELADY